MIERRSESPGRRILDAHKCVFHDEEVKRNADCFAIVKDRLKSAEDKISGTISIKVAEIITTVAMGFLIVFIGACFTIIPSIWQRLNSDLQSMNLLITSMERRMDLISNKQVEIATKQDDQIKLIQQIRNEYKTIKK